MKEIPNWQKNLTLEQIQHVYSHLSLQEIPSGSATVMYDISTENLPLCAHTHNFYEIIVVEHGVVDYYVQGKTYQIQHGDIVFLAPGQLHHPVHIAPESAPYKRIVIWIDPALLKEQSALFPGMDYALLQCQKRNSPILRTIHTSWNSLLWFAQSILKEKEQQDYGSDALVFHLIFSFLTHLNRSVYYQSIEKIPSKADYFNSVFSYIDTHLQEKISLETVAQHLHVSQSTLSHEFSKHMGISFYACVNQRRLLVAKNRMLTTQEVSIAWQDIGFADYTTFYRAFKKEFGTSPKQFLEIAKDPKAYHLTEIL